MHKFPILAAVAVIILSLACNFLTSTSITGSGEIVTREEDITDFDSIDISHSFEATISQGETFSVVIRVDDNIVEHLDVVKQGNTFRIGLKSGRDYNIQNATLQAEVTMPELVGLELSGASQAEITGFTSTKDLKIDLSGSSDLRGDIEAGDATFDLSGSSTMVLTGSGGNLRIDASGSSDVELSAFPVNDANVKASGSSTVTVDVAGRLDADASGASEVIYLGSPTLGTIDTSGASYVESK